MPQVRQRATQRLPFFRGSYPLLYFAILVIMVVVSLTRYHLLIKDIVAEATEDRALQLELLGVYVPDNLLRKSLVSHGTEIQDSLDEELGRHRGVQSLQWEFDGRSYTSDRSGTVERASPPLVCRARQPCAVAARVQGPLLPRQQGPLDGPDARATPPCKRAGSL